MTDDTDITLLLEHAHGGDQKALDAVGRAVHSDLLRRARGLMARREGGGKQPISLEPAELVNETFLKLLRQRKQYRNRQHFFAIATTIMLRVLLDQDKARRRRKRAGGQIRLSLSALGRAHAVAPSTAIPDLVAAFEKLEKLDARVAQVAKLRALWGLTPAEIAEVTGVSRSTVDREWRFARTWLKAALLGSDASGQNSRVQT